MSFIPYPRVKQMIRGKYVAVVGSGPSVLMNTLGMIDEMDVVVRINNYKISAATGSRTDIHYSFYGNSIKKSADQLKRDGVKLCWCKCPDSKPIESAWHVAKNKEVGIDFQYIYRNRKLWWFTDTYIPTDEQFLESFALLGNHIPTTGFSAIYEILKCEPAGVYVTGFDFFASGLHNVNEPWKAGDPTDPIGHVPDAERQWLKDNWNAHNLMGDHSLEEEMNAILV